MNGTLPESRSNATEYTVSEISGALKRTVEDTFGNVRVRGEISGYRGPHSSGHAYFALKDDRSRLEAVVWRGTMGRLKFRPEEGMEVIASGKLTTYPGSSKYQIVIDNLEPAGAGALMALLEERKRRLQAEGLFDAARKQLLPYMPRVIGVVTSPTGAVIRDIIHRTKDRFPLHIVVWPVRVQGETAGAEAAAAVQGFNALPSGGSIARPDVVIVARGGGSLEDLWGFNDEALVRAVAASGIPVISAVGHETDWTLIDLVADARAPTPTGAAEIAVPVRSELEATLARLGARLAGCTSRNLDRHRQAVRAAARALPSPDQLLGVKRRRFDEAESRLERALSICIERQRTRWAAVRLSPLPLIRLKDTARTRLQVASRRHDQALPARLDRLRSRLTQADRLLATLKLSEQAILERGYALVLDQSGALVRRAAQVSIEQALELRFADGAAYAIATDGNDRKSEPRTPTKLPGRSKNPSGQGSLF
ncbi:exodeoxyribonuclease VII large subunit [Manganibacter manganicus]|uniref:Exodeoxyribonuclease 7 large subunit n=1 Tax=Manganibacter manganicus TaxID=1873176 RepID=A0A1V8RQK8_9HYPH|nr:exodeoxyribonuclease VII large subunit [Pseudaminobacter manganicus]OQM75269.1 exodeoxyribonuclease VII large subunit [Pseudaminobacter manganicus]